MAPDPLPAQAPSSPDQQHSAWGSLRRIVSVGKHSARAGPSRESLQSYLQVRRASDEGSSGRTNLEVLLPGPDGISVYACCSFWSTIAPVLLAALQEVEDQGELSISQRRVTIFRRHKLGSKNR